MAQSSSRCNSACRRVFFATGAPGSTSIHFLSRLWDSPWRWVSSWRSSWFCSSLGSACKCKYFRLRCRGFVLVVVVLRVDQACGHCVQPWEIPTRERELSLFTDSILNFTPYLTCKQLVVTSNTSTILVFPRNQPFGSVDLLSRGSVYSRHVTGSAIRKTSVVVEVTHRLSGMWLLQISSQQLSKYNKLGVYRKEWLHYILFDRPSILFVEQAVYRPHKPYPGVSSISACTMQDVVWSNQALVDLCDPYSCDSQTWRIPSVFCSNCPPAVNPEFMMECNLTAHAIMINVLKEIVRNQHVVLKSRNNGIASWMTFKSSEIKNLSWRTNTGLNVWLCLRLLPSCSSIHHQTNIESTRIYSESYLSVSRIRWPTSRCNSPCRRVFILFATGCAWSNWAPGSISIHFLSRLWTVLEDEQAVEGLLGFAFALDRLANAYTSVFVVSLLLVVVVLLVDQVCDPFAQAMRNSDPRVRSVLVHRFNSKFHSIFSLQATGCDFQYGSNFGVPLDPSFRVSWFVISWKMY